MVDTDSTTVAEMLAQRRGLTLVIIDQTIFANHALSYEGASSTMLHSRGLS